MMFICEVFEVFQLAKRLSMSIVGHTSSSSVWKSLEVSVTAHWRVMHVCFFVTVLCAKDWVRVVLIHILNDGV